MSFLVRCNSMFFLVRCRTSTYYVLLTSLALHSESSLFCRPVNSGGGHKASVSGGRLNEENKSCMNISDAATIANRQTVVLTVGDVNKVLKLTHIKALNLCDTKCVVLSGTDSLSVTVYTVLKIDTLPNVSLQQVFTVSMDSYIMSLKHVDLVLLQLHIMISSSYSDRFHQGVVCDGSGIILVCDSLFTSLFGPETNLMNSPVVLFSGYGGAVHWMPLHPGFDVVKPIPRLLCEHNDNICDIIVMFDSDNTSSSDLVFAGRAGSILVVCAASSSASPVHKRCQIVGPVVCCAHYADKMLIYSTGEDLYIANLGLVLDSGSTCSVKSCGLGVRDVVTISVCRSSHPGRPSGVFH